MQNDFKSQIRTLVSKKKKRYQKQGFNLDLSYVTDRIIAMGFPADNFEAIYRNNIDEVSKFFELNHGGNYKIYNLCRERSFDTSKFTGQTVRFPFDDHNPPAFTVLHACIQDISDFLGQCADHVVAINCKAGKGRTGVIVCCSMINAGVSEDASAALTDYAINRTHNRKGVTIPSQIRYVFYYDHFMKHRLRYAPTPVWLRLIKFDMVPLLGNAEVEFAIFQMDSCTRIYLSTIYKVTKHSRMVIFHENISHPLYDDIKFQFFYKSKIGGTRALCHCWLNTFFIVHKPAVQFFDNNTRTTDKLNCFRNEKTKPKNSSDCPVLPPNFADPSETIYKVTLSKPEIDKANKDSCYKIFPENFSITFLFSDNPPNLRLNSNSDCHIGNSTFFGKMENGSMISQLEAMWDVKSPQCYAALD